MAILVKLLIPSWDNASKLQKFQLGITQNIL